MSHLPPPSIRNVLSVPTQDRIDFRAACFCHKDIIDIGFVCSVCLSSQSDFQSLACISLRHLAVQFSVNRFQCAQLVGESHIHVAMVLSAIPLQLCSTKFPMKTLQRLNASRPPQTLTPVNGSPVANGSAIGTPRSAGTTMAASLR
jgi:transcription initiation factor TFIIH subunit 3